MNEIITSGTSYQTYLLKKIDTRKLDEKTEKVNDLIEHIKANDINKTNNLLKADSTQVAKQLGLKLPKRIQKNNPLSKNK